VPGIALFLCMLKGIFSSKAGKEELHSSKSGL